MGQLWLFFLGASTAGPFRGSVACRVTFRVWGSKIA